MRRPVVCTCYFFTCATCPSHHHHNYQHIHHHHIHHQDSILDRFIPRTCDTVVERSTSVRYMGGAKVVSLIPHVAEILFCHIYYQRNNIQLHHHQSVLQILATCQFYHQGLYAVCLLAVGNSKQKHFCTVLEYKDIDILPVETLIQLKASGKYWPFF